MDDGADASPDRYGGYGGGSFHLACYSCGEAAEYSPDDFPENGYFSCSRCGAEHTAHGHRVLHQWPWPNHRPPPRPRRYHLQRQLEALVETFQVGALVCGVAGTVWVRWVAASKVFDETWARKVLADDQAKLSSSTRGEEKHQELKFEPADGASAPRQDRRRVEFVFLRSLRTTLPLYSTLSVCFLACHVAREAILPTDIYRWPMEGKLPYVAAFTQVEKLLGSSRKQHCSLNARHLFRPVRVIGAWQLEAAAGSIAQRISWGFLWLISMLLLDAT